MRRGGARGSENHGGGDRWSERLLAWCVAVQRVEQDGVGGQRGAGAGRGARGGVERQRGCGVQHIGRQRIGRCGLRFRVGYACVRESGNEALGEHPDHR